MLNIVAGIITVFIFATVAGMMYAATVNPIGVITLLGSIIFVVLFYVCFRIIKKILPQQ